MSQQLDAQGEAHDALGTAVSSYGQRVLRDPHMLGNLVTDLLPDLPRERSLLVTGAEAGIAAEMKQHVEEQHIDPDTAVQLVARALSERRAIDPAASMWVASEYAQALGYRVRPYTEAVQSEQPQVIPAVPPTMTALSGQPMPTLPPQGPPAAQVPQRPPAQSWPPGQPWPPPQVAPGGPPPAANRRKRGPIIAAIAVAGAVVLYLVVAAVAHTVPFAKSHAVASPSPTVTHTHPRPTPKPSLTLAANVVPLTQLLPSDMADTATDCHAAKPPYNWSMPGLVQALTCDDPGLLNGVIEAYQMNNSADFQTAWHNFNTWWGFNISTAETNCPPTGGSNAQGTYGFTSKDFPSTDGQVVECETVSGSSGGNSTAPAYAWALPTEDAFFIAQGADGSSFKALDTWWINNSGPANPPTASPSPKAS